MDAWKGQLFGNGIPISVSFWAKRQRTCLAANTSELLLSHGTCFSVESVEHWFLLVSKAAEDLPHPGIQQTDKRTKIQNPRRTKPNQRIKVVPILVLLKTVVQIGLPIWLRGSQPRRRPSVGAGTWLWPLSLAALRLTG